MTFFQQNPPTDAVSVGLDAITRWVRTWGIPLAAIGTISMALLQTAKNTLPLRRWFQKYRLLRWLTNSASQRCPCNERPDPLKAENDLISLVTSGDRNAFYNLPIEDLCAQMKGVITVILDYPSLHQDLLYCFASGAKPEDIRKMLQPPSVETFLRHGEHSSHEEKHAIREYAAAKTRLSVQVACSIDAIRMSIGFRWKLWMQIISLVLSAVLGVVALYLGIINDPNNPQAPGFPTKLGTTLIIGLLSGFLAPVARDLVAAVEKWRN